MKIDFKIMWVDDKPDKMKPILNEIEEVLKENYYIPRIDAAFQSYDSFRAVFDISLDEDGGISAFNDCDLLLVDFHLSERVEDDEKTGEALIDQLRKKGVFTEVIFYSDAMDEYRKSDNRRELDNVTYADKSEVVRKVEHLVKKSVRQGMNISNFRGYLMDSTSEFDFICKEAAVHFFKLLGEEQQKDIIKKVEEYIQEHCELEVEKFKKSNVKYRDLLTQVKSQRIIRTFSSATTEQRIAILSETLNSKFALITNAKKFRILAKILSAYNISAPEKICHYDENGHPHEIYSATIISARNKLAHGKLIYGEPCGSRRIKIVETLSEIACDSECLCDMDTPPCINKSYSYEDCKTLRKNIYDYYLIFNDLFKYIMQK